MAEALVAKGPKKARRLERAERTVKLALVVENPREEEEIIEPRSTKRGKKTRRASASCKKSRERVVLVAIAYFRRCFSFFNCLFFSLQFYSSSSLLLFTAIVFLILLLYPQSALVHSLQSLLFKLYLSLGGPTSKNLVSPICILIIGRIAMTTFKMFMAFFCFKSF